mgnify:CR=1 FL=1
MSADAELALRLADYADEISLARYRAHDLQVETKPDLTPVSDADKAVETALRNHLQQTRPEDAVVGEEFGSGEGERVWIVDPIDGTKNYIRGVPVWATLIALRIADEITLGVVSAPALGRRWWAARGEGAFTIGPESSVPRAIRVSAVQDIEDSSLSFSDAVGWPKNGKGLQALLRNTWRQRAYGDFWSHMLVAEGAVDVAVEPELQSYDVAALIPIIEEAGGHCTTLTNGWPGDGGSLVSTNSLLHNQVLELLKA